MYKIGIVLQPFIIVWEWKVSIYASISYVKSFASELFRITGNIHVTFQEWV